MRVAGGGRIRSCFLDIFCWSREDQLRRRLETWLLLFCKLYSGAPFLPYDIELGDAGAPEEKHSLPPAPIEAVSAREEQSHEAEICTDSC